MEIQNNYLQHHGVKGQKWGVRKEPEETAKSRNSFDDEMLNYERQQAKLQKKEEKKQKRERTKKIFFGVALTTAGIAVVAALIKNLVIKNLQPKLYQRIRRLFLLVKNMLQVTIKQN